MLDRPAGRPVSRSAGWLVDWSANLKIPTNLNWKKVQAVWLLKQQEEWCEEPMDDEERLPLKSEELRVIYELNELTHCDRVRLEAIKASYGGAKILKMYPIKWHSKCN